MKPEGFNLELELLSPLHIGDGSTLVPMEYVFDSQQEIISVANLDFLIEALPPEKLERLGERMWALDDFLQNIGQGHLLRKPELYLREMRTLGAATQDLLKDLGKNGKQPPGGHRYKGRHDRRPDGRKDAKRTINRAQIKTFIKTGERPFIPGSSVKGAFRTALAYTVLKEAGESKAKEILEASVNKPDSDAVEKYLLRAGDGIDQDVMALIGFSDSEPIDPARLVVVRGKRINGPPTSYYEALLVGTKATLSVFFSNVKRDKNQDLIPPTSKDFMDVLNRFAKAFIAFEKKQVHKMRDQAQRSAYAEQHGPNLDRIVRFYQALETKMNQNPDAGFMSLGWGTGWAGKTVGMLLKDQPKFKNVMHVYGMGGRRKEPRDFPVSREVILGQNVEPLFGWVMLRRV